MKSIKILPLTKSIKAEVSIPGSKSYTNRALLMAAMTDQNVKIVNPLISDDTEAMIECLRRLGLKIMQKDNNIEIINDISAVQPRSYDLDANLSGTTIRFILALTCVVPGVKTLYGKPGLNNRPIAELVDGLRQLGAQIEYIEKEGFPPLRITSSKLSPGVVEMDGSISSQYFSALLMIAPLVGDLTIKVLGEQISKPYIDMTMDTMKKFNVSAINKKYKKYIVTPGQKYQTNKYVVEGDVSSASYFAAIAVLTKSTITLTNMNPLSVQADMGFLAILEKMGNQIVYGEDKITIIGNGVKALTVDMESCPDQAQTLSVLAAFAKGKTEISGIQSLRVKETERVLAIEQELKKMNTQAVSTTNTLTINGGKPHPAQIGTYGDHRMAMSFAVAGTKLAGIEINDPDVVSKTFPEFWKKLNEIGVQTELVKQNVVLIGMRGSGKTTIAKLLSQRLNREYFELDEIMVKKLGMTIPEIVDTYGWDHFRDQESAIVQEVSLLQNKILSTGGGVVTREKNISALKQNGFLVLLSASVGVLSDRIGEDLNRPSLTNKKSRREEMEELLKQREKLYLDAADVVIDINQLKPEEIVNQILQKLKE